MAKRYVRFPIRKETFEVFVKRYNILNSDLKDMGYKHNVPKTKFMDLIIKNSRVGEEYLPSLVNKRKIRRIG